MKKPSLVLLGLIVLGSCALRFFLLTRGHVWPDDFAGYLLQTKSLLDGQLGDLIRHNAFTLDHSSYPPGPLAYPWGFPLLLAPVLAVFGLNTLALKLVGVLFYGGFLLAFFFLARPRLPQTDALLLTGVFATLPALLPATDLILSDIPFLAFSTLCLVLFETLPRHGFRMGLLAGFCMFSAAFLRANGLLLAAPLLVSLVLSYWPGWQDGLKKAAPPLLVFVALYVLQSILLPSGQGSYFSHFSLFSLARLWDNVLFYAWLPVSAFDGLPGGALIYPVMLVLSVASLAVHWRRDAALHVYGLLTMLLFILWPERQGLRFIYPVLPLLFIFALDGALALAARLAASRAGILTLALKLGLGSLILVCLWSGGQAAVVNMANNREINGPFDQYSYQMYAFIREKTPPASVIIFMRPRALRLFTGRDAFMTDRCADLSQGNYIALHEKAGDNSQISPEQVTRCDPRLRLGQVFNNKRFTVYRISPAP